MIATLTTPRLILRPPVEADWPAYRDYRMSPRSTVAGGDAGMVWTLFAAFFGHWALRGFGRFIITLRDDGHPIGHCGPYWPEGHSEGELTWTLWDDIFEGKGYAFEAAMAARAHVFGALGWETAVSYINPDNARSIALAKRLGAVIDEAAPHPYGDEPTLTYRHLAGGRA